MEIKMDSWWIVLTWYQPPDKRKHKRIIELPKKEDAAKWLAKYEEKYNRVEATVIRRTVRHYDVGEVT